MRQLVSVVAFAVVVACFPCQAVVVHGFGTQQTEVLAAKEARRFALSFPQFAAHFSHFSACCCLDEPSTARSDSSVPANH
jgi:hypothetical protein